MVVDRDHPLLRLSEADLSMVCSFVLVSGSIKDLAREYGVSYPTMRHRLDGLIERLRRNVDGEPRDPIGELLADLIARGEIVPATARAVRELHRSLLADARRGSRKGEPDDV